MQTTVRMFDLCSTHTYYPVLLPTKADMNLILVEERNCEQLSVLLWKLKWITCHLHATEYPVRWFICKGCARMLVNMKSYCATIHSQNRIFRGNIASPVCEKIRTCGHWNNGDPKGHSAKRSHQNSHHKFKELEFLAIKHWASKNRVACT